MQECCSNAFVSFETYFRKFWPLKSIESCHEHSLAESFEKVKIVKTNLPRTFPSWVKPFRIWSQKNQVQKWGYVHTEIYIWPLWKTPNCVKLGRSNPHMLGKGSAKSHANQSPDEANIIQAKWPEKHSPEVSRPTNIHALEVAVFVWPTWRSSKIIKLDGLSLTCQTDVLPKFQVNLKSKWES